MPKKEVKEEPVKAEPVKTKAQNTIYRAVLMVGDSQLASIALRASDDEDAKEQLARAKPSHFEGVGEWKLTKNVTVEVN